MEMDFYFSQFEIKNTAVINYNTELCRVKMVLHTKLSQFPKYCVCKIFRNPTDQNLIEASMMKEFCTQNHPGIIKYYHHFHLDQLYIFLEDCYTFQSGFEDISASKKTKNINQEIHPQLSSIRYFTTQSLNLLSAVKLIHDSGYIHSDIAPKNIFISKELDYKLGDFGSIVKKNSFVYSFTSYFLQPSDYQKKLNGSRLTATETMDFFALGKSLFELIILRNQIPMERFINKIRFLEFVREELRMKISGDYQEFYKVIEMVINGNSVKAEEINVITTKCPQFTEQFRTTQSKGYCTGCMEVGYSIQLIKSNSEMELLQMFEKSGGKNIGKLFSLRCLHQYHIKCYVKKARENRVLCSNCPECRSFIGVRAFKLLSCHPDSKGFMMN